MRWANITKKEPAERAQAIGKGAKGGGRNTEGRRLTLWCSAVPLAVPWLFPRADLYINT